MERLWFKFSNKEKEDRRGADKKESGGREGKEYFHQLVQEAWRRSVSSFVTEI